MSQFTFELARAAIADPKLRAAVSVSRQNELFSAFAEFGTALLPIDTFETNLGAATQLWRLPLIRSRLSDFLHERKIEAVIDLMPHIWSPLVITAIKAAGSRYVPVHHDAGAHPGDKTSVVKGLIDRSLNGADLIVTLSEAVAGGLRSGSNPPKARIVTLFLPDLAYGGHREPEPPPAGTPWRLLFLGRIMPYKGLPLFLEAIDILRSEGVPVEIGVFGEGALGNASAHLNALGAEVTNRWLTESEIGEVLQRYHAVVLSHTEASQSGVAAAAFGAGIPVVATPVGGLVEQIEDGITGILAKRIDGEAIATAVTRLLSEPGLYATICQNIADRRSERSMDHFIERCAGLAVGRHL